MRHTVLLLRSTPGLLLSLFINLIVATAAMAVDDAVERGRQLYLSAGGYGCQVCHGLVAHGAGQAGGAIRGANLQALRTSLESNAPMQPLLAVLPMEKQQILAAYLLSLADIPLLQLTFDQAQWSLQAENFVSGQTVELVLYNGSFDSQTLDLSSLGLGTIEVAPLATESYRAVVQQDRLSLSDGKLF